jgi:hypothetical protein
MAVALMGCGPAVDQEDPVLARAYDQYLRWSDLRQLIPMGMAPEDSAVMAQAHINNWLQQQVVLHKAEANLAPSEKDFEAQLRDYRNSLVLFAYEQALVDQKLDTVVSDADVQSYYEANSANFELKDHAVRARWFRVSGSDKRVMRRVEEQFNSDKEEKRRELEIWLASQGVPIIDKSSVWTYWADLGAEFPVALPEPSGTGRMVLRQDTVAWFIEVLELRPRKSSVPVSLVRRDIRTMIINQRKLQLVARMREDLYSEALQNKDVEVR